MNQSLVATTRKIKFFQLAAFDRVLSCGSLMKAADALSLTQPTVTKIVQDLEFHFGAPLLVRGKRGVVPTDLGEIIGRRARSMLSELRALTEEVETFRRGAAGYFRIGSSVSASMTVIPLALQTLKSRAPGVTASIQSGQLTQMLTMLRVGELDMIVDHIPDDWAWRSEAEVLHVTPLYEDRAALITGNLHPFHSMKSPSLPTLARYTWVLPPRNSGLQQRIMSFFAQAGIALPTNIMESASAIATLGLLKDQESLALLPENVVNPFVKSGMVRIIKTPGTIDFGRVGCFVRANNQSAPVLQLILDCLTESSTLEASTLPGAPALHTTGFRVIS